MGIWYLLLLLFPSTSLTLAISRPNLEPTTNLLTRDTATCSKDPTLQVCPANIPFCCPKNTACKPTTPDNHTVICCPSGQDCSFIQPVTCDISQQDASKFPSNTLHTIDLNAVLQKCGNECCPSGYSCQGGNCALIKNSPSSSSTTSAAPTSSTTNPPVVIPSHSPSDDNKTASSSSQFPPGAVILGLVLGLLAGAALMFLVLWCLRRRAAKHSSDPSSKKKLHRTSTATFMGTTPRPLSVSSPHEVSSSAATTVVQPSGQNASQNNAGQSYYAPNKAQSGAMSTISEPMWASNLGPPAHRTDFLLRRGDCSTGLEDRIAMRSSTTPVGASTLERGRSRRAMADASTAKDAVTPEKSKAADAKGPRTPESQVDKPGRLPPVFTSPLKFGLPISPSPAGKGQNAGKGKEKPKRPLRSDENIVGMLGTGSSDASFATAPTASAENRQRDDSARRPLIAGRSDSHDSNVTTFSEGDGGEVQEMSERKPDEKQKKEKEDSSETINVLLPPPNVFRTPPPSGGTRWNSGTDAERRDTTFEDLMKKAGWRKSEWKK